MRFALALGCIGGVADAREIAKQFTLALTVSTPVALPTPEASPVQPVAEQPLEMSRRSRRTEGLSDKHSLHGKFGKNVALWCVRNSRLSLSPWYTVGRVNADCASVISRRKHHSHGYVYHTVEIQRKIIASAHYPKSAIVRGNGGRQAARPTKCQ